MKHVFIWGFATLTILSVGAWWAQPEPVDQRAEQLAFFLEYADHDQSGTVSPTDLHEFLEALDRNNDGVISRNDIDETTPWDEAELIERIIDEFDEQGDGQVRPQDFDRAFEFLDRDGDGLLTEADFPGEMPTEIIWVSDDNPVRREQIRLFNRLHPDTQLTLDPQNQGMEKVIVQSVGGVGPDLFDAYDAYQLSAYVRAGIAKDLTDIFEERGISIDALWPGLLPVITHEGRIYGHPTNVAANAVWYNKRIFDEAGIPYPTDDWTWDEAIEISQQLTRRNERGVIVRFGIIGNWDWKLALFQHHADFFNEEGTRCILDRPEAARALQFMQDLVHKYEVMPSAEEESALASAGGWGAGALSLFGAERGAMAIGGRWWLCSLRDESYDHLELGAVRIPGLPMPDGTISHRVNAYGRGTLINNASENVEEAVDFLEYMHGPEYNKLINRQADALAPVREYSYTEEYLHNPDFPEEDYNEVWRSVLEDAAAEIPSPFINGQRVQRILNVQMDLLRANLKSGEAAGRDAARRINEEIVRTLERDPELREKYFEALERGAEPAWDDEADAPR